MVTKEGFCNEQGPCVLIFFICSQSCLWHMYPQISSHGTEDIELDELKGKVIVVSGLAFVYT